MESYKSISNGAQYVTPVKFIVEKFKMCRSRSGNWFFCTKFVQLGATQFCTSSKECNKLHLTAAQYF
jgi:hypothetical protein